jgi:mRNA (2'-O-methyladenosine-N6-)-methyltransferase
LEIFARKNNLRNYWVSIGNEVTGTGLPEEDMQAFKQTSAIPGAVYGRGSGTNTAAAAAAGGAG